eukprot:7185450-Prymnesium_polylepis.1
MAAEPAAGVGVARAAARRDADRDGAASLLPAAPRRRRRCWLAAATGVRGDGRRRGADRQAAGRAAARPGGAQRRR